MKFEYGWQMQLLCDTPDAVKHSARSRIRLERSAGYNWCSYRHHLKGSLKHTELFPNTCCVLHSVLLCNVVNKLCSLCIRNALNWLLLNYKYFHCNGILSFKFLRAIKQVSGTADFLSWMKIFCSFICLMLLREFLEVIPVEDRSTEAINTWFWSHASSDKPHSLRLL
jgi:hypothetical protein